MTIATLLSHVGISVPRYVTVDGEIVLDASPRVAGHPAPIAVAPHRFHGGDDPAPLRETFEAAWWNTDAERRVRDEEDVREHFPGFVLMDDDRDYSWFGTLNTGRGSFEIFVLPHADGSLPSIHPRRRNLGRPEGRKFRKPPHLYSSGALCVADQSDWNPDEHTTATAIAWAAHWFGAYTEWRMSVRWPTDGHGAAAA